MPEIYESKTGVQSWVADKMHRPILLVAVLVLAGCLSGVGPTSPAGPPETEWTNGDSINTTTLAEQHFETLREAGSFTTNHSETIRVDGETRPDGPRPDGYHPPTFTEMQVNLAEGRYLDTVVTVGDRRSNHFITPDVTAMRRRQCPACDYDYSYQQRPESDTRSKRIDRFRSRETVTQFARLLRGVTVGFSYSYAGTVERDDETLHRYHAEQSLETAPPPFSAPPNGTATVLVTAEGVIRRFELQYAGPATVTVNGDDRTVDVTHTFVRTYTDVGETTIERPAWVDRAATQDTPRTTETAEQGRWIRASCSARRCYHIG